MQPEPIVLRGHYDATGAVERIEVVEAPALSLISPELLAVLVSRYREGADVLVFAPDVRYLLGDAYGEHGERLLHRLP